jgi:hypothetical protein
MSSMYCSSNQSNSLAKNNKRRFTFSIEVLSHASCFFLFILMLTLPYKFQILKLILLLLSILFIFFRRNVLVTTKVFYWVIIYLLMGGFEVFNGILRQNPAPEVYFAVNVIWPILFMLVITTLRKNSIKNLIFCFRWSLFIISISGIFAFFYFNFLLIKQGEILGFIATIRPGFPFIAIHSGAIVSVIFLYIFFLTLYFTDNKLSKIDAINLVLGIIFIFMTSRRAIFLLILLAIFITFSLLGFVNKNQQANYLRTWKLHFVFLIVLVGIVFLVNFFFKFLDFVQLYKFLEKASQSSKYNDLNVRELQFGSLIKGWMQSPIIGNGAGINASVVRSNIPGSYELTYVAMLFSRGLIGMLIYIFQYILINIWAIRLLRLETEYTKYILATIVAFNIFMFANATNPYLGAFDHMWVIFIMLYFINIFDVKSEKNMHPVKGL